MHRSHRSAARWLAVQALYRMELGPTEPAEALAFPVELHGAPEEVADFARQLVEDVHQRREEIDRLLAEHLPESWSLGRIGKMEKVIMRLACGELLRSEDVPTAVVLDEALELTRDFVDEKAVAFVNAVLDRTARRVRPQGAGKGA